MLDIERVPGRTEVLVQEGVQTVSYALDENMISLDACLEVGDLRGAAGILAPQPLTPDTEARWQQLADRALDSLDLAVAEQCYAAIGDISRAAFVRGLVDLAAQSGGADSAAVRARLAVLRKQWHVAEGLMLQQGQVEEVIRLETGVTTQEPLTPGAHLVSAGRLAGFDTISAVAVLWPIGGCLPCLSPRLLDRPTTCSRPTPPCRMYREVHKWDDVLRVARKAQHADYPLLRTQYYDWLVSTQQFDK